MRRSPAPPVCEDAAWAFGGWAVAAALLAAVSDCVREPPSVRRPARRSPRSVRRRRAQPLHLVLPLTADLAGLRRGGAGDHDAGLACVRRLPAPETLARRFGASPQTRRRVAHTFVTRARAEVRDRRDRTVRRREHERRPGAPALFETPSPGSARVAHASSRPRRRPTPLPLPPPHGLQRPPASPPALAGLVTGVVGLDNRSLTGAGRLPPKPARTGPSPAPRRCRRPRATAAGPRLAVRPAWRPAGSRRTST